MTPEQERIYEGLLKKIIENPEFLDDLIECLEEDIVGEETL